MVYIHLDLNSTRFPHKQTISNYHASSSIVVASKASRRRTVVLVTVVRVGLKDPALIAGLLLALVVVLAGVVLLTSGTGLCRDRARGGGGGSLCLGELALNVGEGGQRGCYSSLRGGVTAGGSQGTHPVGCMVG